MKATLFFIIVFFTASYSFSQDVPLFSKGEDTAVVKEVEVHDFGVYLVAFNQKIKKSKLSTAFFLKSKDGKEKIRPKYITPYILHSDSLTGLFVFENRESNFGILHSNYFKGSVNVSGFRNSSISEPYLSEYNLLLCKHEFEKKNTGNFEQNYQKVDWDNPYVDGLYLKYEVRAMNLTDKDSIISHLVKSYDLGNRDTFFLRWYFKVLKESADKFYNKDNYEEARNSYENIRKLEFPENLKDSVIYPYVFSVYKVNQNTSEKIQEDYIILLKTINIESSLYYKAKLLEGNIHYYNRNYGDAESCYKEVSEKSQDEKLREKAKENLKLVEGK